MSLMVASQVELIPGYRLIERLGSGGFGEVWKAEAPGGMLKAVKIINGNLSDSMVDQTPLKQELKALHRVRTIRHPYILALDRFEIVDGRLIIITELADCTLFDRFKECHSRGNAGIPRSELLGYMKETAEALDLMNEQFNLQHLDIKPQNIFLLFNHVKVGDFGLVKDLDGMFAAVTSGVTAVYAAPETFEGVVSRYCDQYNLAIAYQEMLTGKLPFDGTTGRQLMMQHTAGVPDLSALPTADQPAVARALSKKPEDRFASCQDFVQALFRAGASSTSLENGTAPARPLAESIVEKPGPVPTPLWVEPVGMPTLLTRIGGRPTPGFAYPPTPPGEHPVFATMDREPSKKKSVGKPTDLVDYVPPPSPPERTETTGDGILLPAFVVGLGGLGRDVLQEFRKSLRKRGPAEPWPHIRLLNIDTDPEAHDRASREPNSVLAAEEILVTHFHRLSHYLKRPHERDNLGRWLPLNQLTSVARGQITAEGWRALGRLAFVSSGAALAARLRQELEACADETTLKDAARRTALGLRTTRPRVYVVTSLTGGTGSGMFLDLAATLRRELAQLGYPHAELVAVLLAPATKGNIEARGVANAYAALSELKHFGAVQKGLGNVAPFDRCVMLPLPAKSDGAFAFQELTSLAGDFLSRELTTPLGRVADESRKTLKHAGAGLPCQTFGAYWFSVPRRPLLRQVVQHLCDRVVRGWGVYDSNAMAEALKSWASDQIAQANLSADSLSARLQEECAATLGQSLNAWLAALMQSWAKGRPGDLGTGDGAVRKALAELEALLGSPEQEPDLQLDSPLLTALAEARRCVAEAAEGQVAELALGALSEPRFRLACQEEAAQEQLGVVLDATAQCHGRRSAEQRRHAHDIFQQIAPFRAELQAGGLFRGWARARAADSIRILLARYLNARLNSVLELAACRLFQELHANLHKHRRAVDCCHKRIGQFLNTFDDLATDAPPVDLGLGRYLLPFGCQTLDEAVARILDSLPAEEEDALRDNVWRLIHSTLQENVHVCTAPTSLFRGLRERIDCKAEKVAEDSLGRAHAAKVYLERQAEHANVDTDLASAFDEAQPELGPGHGNANDEFSILAVPPGPEGERFRALVKHALPDVPMVTAVSTDDIVFYREQSFASLDELPQLGAGAREQYTHILTTEQFGPHSRVDIVW
jgi:eukaryotic-like serine/threonine-protein kinase